MLDEDESTLKVYILQGGCSDSPRQVKQGAVTRAGIDMWEKRETARGLRDRCIITTTSQKLSKL